MELRVLRYFLTVARLESITHAANVLHVTQPTLSRQLADLEKNLGTQLLIRGKKKGVINGCWHAFTSKGRRNPNDCG
ncbi:LysR family transcriptional regulator [Paenibacillus sp. ICGEB2008]|uniref:LysR family transcriptional regulator n=1 Tax=Paenibacillus sp. ICGEB2008 TaxID=996640 RepID=UPI0002FAFDC3|nr:LysR family transcriptional regulator [Paenibacillus sp. ICGEB2008]